MSRAPSDPRDDNYVAGGCHCGAVRFFVRIDPDAQLLECNCSICAKKGFLHLIVDEAGLDTCGALDEPSVLTEYRFGTQTAVHMFCRRCGIAPYYRPRSHPDGWSVNARCLDDGYAEFEIVPFDGANWERARERLKD